MDTLRDDLMNALLGWDLLTQMEEAVKSVQYARMADGRYRYPCTDAELRTLGVLVAFDALNGQPGEYRFPSGAAVFLGEDLDLESSYRCEGQVLPSDLLPQISQYIQRMPLHLQPQRERDLPRLHREQEEMHRQAEAQRPDAIEARRRDRQLIIRNRQAAGLEPLAPELLPPLHPDDLIKEAT